LLRFLGKGSYGQVVLGKCRQTGYKVAIKLVGSYSSSEYATVKLVREIQIMRGLKDMAEEDQRGHLFTPELHELIKAEDTAGKPVIFMVMEHVESDLISLIKLGSKSGFNE
jgi:serine/threonine protein kinase